eukprot:COSAG02_NODE_8052_length_2731_cov_3.361322_1_plen_226_part_00
MTDQVCGAHDDRPPLGHYRLTDCEILTRRKLRTEMDNFRDWWGMSNEKTFAGWKNDTREFLGFLLRLQLKDRCTELCLKDCAEIKWLRQFYRFKRDVRKIRHPKKFLSSMLQTVSYLTAKGLIEKSQSMLLRKEIQEIKVEHLPRRLGRPEPPFTWDQAKHIQLALLKEQKSNPGDERIHQDLVAFSCFVKNPPLRAGDFREAVIKQQNDEAYSNIGSQGGLARV